MSDNIITKKNYCLHIKEILTLIFIMLIFITALCPRSSCSTGILKGIYFCVNTLVPSIFPFMVICSFISASGLSGLIGNIFCGITKFLFYLPGCATTTIIMGLVGGYPIGAKGVEELLSQCLINEEQANRIMKFAVGAGPGFIINAVGGIILKNKTIGVVIFVSQISVSLLIGILLGINARLHRIKFYAPEINYGPPKKLSISWIKSCGGAAENAINMCALVIMFSAILAVLNDMNISSLLCNTLSFFGVPDSISQSIIPIFMEVNSACISATESYYPAVFISFAIGWAGLCVHLQIMSVFSKTNSIDIKQFTIFRLVQGCLSSITTYICLFMIDLSSSTLSTLYLFKPHYGLYLHSSLQGGISLVIICVYFLYDIINFIPQRIKPK